MRNAEPGKWVKVELNIDTISGEILIMFNRAPGSCPEVAPLTPALIQSLGDAQYSRNVAQAQALREARKLEEARRPKLLDDIDLDL